jgi:alkylhydroperoxidase family enzyme
MGGGRRSLHRTRAGRAALTGEITELTGRGHVSDKVYSRAAAVFSERELGQIIAMAVSINAWNRIGVTTRLGPPRR